MLFHSHLSSFLLYRQKHWLEGLVICFLHQCVLHHTILCNLAMSAIMAQSQIIRGTTPTSFAAVALKVKMITILVRVIGT